MLDDVLLKTKLSEARITERRRKRSGEQRAAQAVAQSMGMKVRAQRDAEWLCWYRCLLRMSRACEGVVQQAETWVAREAVASWRQCVRVDRPMQHLSRPSGETIGVVAAGSEPVLALQQQVLHLLANTLLDIDMCTQLERALASLDEQGDRGVDPVLQPLVVKGLRQAAQLVKDARSTAACMALSPRARANIDASTGRADHCQEAAVHVR